MKMKRNILIFIFLVVLPLVLVKIIPNLSNEYSFVALSISILASIWIVIRSIKLPSSKIRITWIIIGALLVIVLSLYFWLAYAWVHADYIL